tara:strand:+ start:335 stop:700 length:366 start_codon:yes stop_codon:yes gene_type:complete
MNGFLSVIILSSFWGCANKEEDTAYIICTSEISFSVYVTFYNETGGVVDNAEPSVSVDGGSAIACEEDSIGGHYCGEELEGEVTVSLVVDGYELVEETVTVEANDCHVITEIVDITLVPTE